MASKPVDSTVKMSNSKVPSLLDIPPEVRNMIYSMLFWMYEPIFISVYGWGSRVSLKYSCPGMLPASMLRVNRQIWAEATPIMYGRNKFDFDTPCALLIFLRRTAAKQHLRSLTIDIFLGWRSITKAFRQLKGAPLIQQLTIQYHHLDERISSGEWMHMLRRVLPWLKVMRSRLVEHGECNDVLDVLQFEGHFKGGWIGDPSGFWEDDPTDAEAAQHGAKHAALCLEWKTALRKAMR